MINKIMNEVKEMNKTYENKGNGIAYDYFISLSVSEVLKMENTLIEECGEIFTPGTSFQGVFEHIDCVVELMYKHNMI